MLTLLFFTCRSFFQLVGDLDELRDKRYGDELNVDRAGRAIRHHAAEKETAVAKGETIVFYDVV